MAKDVILPQPQRRFERLQNLGEAALLVGFGQSGKVEERAEVGVFLGRDIKPVLWKFSAQT
ncbi:hypothetical protein [Ruegeria arenilitoris]|uniref:hypothetical protein n=1 Tax=Ruegeria arenilitoris TaxID=1173585 RepID=UPI0020C1D815|nr:hypothetical protein [Ruegeria arenilitoris]